ncbi:4'-phosphopantetheinyl transferase superfamily protein [Flavobacteriaceae bacterium]|nr:4'-phosphopantetheinyl transferase superfamily protein [Flavobacteriaceae bacterium]
MLNSSVLSKNLSITPFSIDNHQKTFPAFLASSTYSFAYLIKNIDKFLAQAEKNDFANLPNIESRKRSFLLGRLSAKKAIMALTKIENIQNIQISWGTKRQPIVTCQNYPNVEISISHSQDITMAIAFDKNCPMSIDIEKFTSAKNQSVKSQLTKHELCNFDKSTIDSLLLWTMKEALSKLLKTGLGVDFRFYEISQIFKKSNHIEGYFSNFPQYKVLSYVIGDLIYSLIIRRY